MPVALLLIGLVWVVSTPAESLYGGCTPGRRIGEYAQEMICGVVPEALQIEDELTPEQIAEALDIPERERARWVARYKETHGR